MHQQARRVVDEHQQRALRPAVLEPPVLAAVDLHQLADTLPPMPRLMDALPSLLAISPNPGRDHPQPQRLAAERDRMPLAQLLGRQGGTKIPILLANDRQRLDPKLFRFAPVARSTSPLRDQAGRAIDPVRLQQPEHLTALEPQQLRCRRSRHPSLI